VRALAVLFGASLAVGCGRLGFDGDPPNDGNVDGPPSFRGLTVRYAFDDDPTDGVVPDSTGRGLDARCIVGSSCPTSAPGRYGNALHFDGAAHVLRVTDSPTFSTPRELSVAVWAFLEVDKPVRVPVSKPFGIEDDNTWSMYSSPTNTCVEAMIADGQQGNCSPIPLPLGRWFHMATVWTGGELVLYVDGVQVTSAPFTSDILFDSHDMLIGADEDFGTTTHFWPGFVDELQIYDRALSTAELAALAAP
jgi:hypothetical protein